MEEWEAVWEVWEVWEEWAVSRCEGTLKILKCSLKKLIHGYVSLSECPYAPPHLFSCMALALSEIMHSLRSLLFSLTEKHLSLSLFFPSSCVYRYS